MRNRASRSLRREYALPSAWLESRALLDIDTGEADEDRAGAFRPRETKVLAGSMRGFPPWTDPREPSE